MFEMGINSFNIVISKSWYVPQIKDKAISMRNSMLNVQNYQKVFINQNQGSDKQDNQNQEKGYFGLFKRVGNYFKGNDQKEGFIEKKDILSQQEDIYIQENKNTKSIEQVDNTFVSESTVVSQVPSEIKEKIDPIKPQPIPNADPIPSFEPKTEETKTAPRPKVPIPPRPKVPVKRRAPPSLFNSQVNKNQSKPCFNYFQHSHNHYLPYY